MNRRMRDMRWCLFTAALFAMALVAMPAMPNDPAPTSPPPCECESGQPLKGAIFTTVVDGTRVNANQYDFREDVYLDGGPGDQAPSSAAALPEGCYYFQVTDPSGKTLLSEDPVKCRKIHVNSHGVIDWVYSDTKEAKVKGQYVQVDCTHNEGVDADHSDVNAITVQLFPFSRTPNHGGVYKVWITRICDFQGNPNREDPENNGNKFFGFKPSASKTDNFKVKGQPQPKIHVHKYNDVNCNGELDSGDQEIVWKVDIEKPLGDTSTIMTPIWIDPADTGDWTFTEDRPAGWFPTGLIIDGVKQDEPFYKAVVTVTGARGEADHTVIFLNAQAGDLKVCKQYDKDGDGKPDSPPVDVKDWKFLVDKVGDPEFETLMGVSGPDGCYTFRNLKPGTYKVTELFPDDTRWCPSGPTMQTVEVKSGETATFTFFNFCKGTAITHTKGFWQNPHGCEIIGNHPEYLDFLNTLDPYDGQNGNASVLSQGTDNCNGGKCDTYVDLPFDSNTELGCFIVTKNSQPEYRNTQLAQQLAAFVLNAQHFMGDVDTTFWFMGTKYVASDLINAAVTAWATGSAADVQFYQGLLAAINEEGTVQVILPEPCPVNYTS